MVVDNTAPIAVNWPMRFWAGKCLNKIRFSVGSGHQAWSAKEYRIEDPALNALALIVRGADTARLELTPQSPGLLAVSLGLSAIYADDHTMLEHGMTVYDALYAWCRDCREQGHDWNPAAMISAKA